MPQTPEVREPVLVTSQMVEMAIADEVYFTAEQGYQAASRSEYPALAAQGNGFPYSVLKLATVCVLVLAGRDRGVHTVVGVAQAQSEKNYSWEIGKVIAKQDALRKLWPMVIYQQRMGG